MIVEPIATPIVRPVVAPIVGNGVPEYASMDTFSSQADVTPNVVQVTLSGTQTAIRVWFGDQDITEAYFYLYASKNGAAASKIKCYRYSTVILGGTKGDTFALGTSDGREISVSRFTVPTVLETSYAVTDTANCDQAGPPLWEPSGAHVVLPGRGQAIEIQADGTDRPVFIREWDPGSGTWTPTRFIMLHRTRATAVRCTYEQIALANYAGASLSVKGPAGTVIGGTKAVMHLTFPGGTGTLRAVTTVANFKTAMAAAVSGDIIELATGTYTMDVEVQDSTFAANGNSAKGILIRGASGTATDVVITGNGSGANGKFSVTGGTSSEPVMLKDLSFNFAALTGTIFQISSGHALVENVKSSGATTDTLDLFNFAGTGAAATMDYLWCVGETAGTDIFNGDGNASYNADSQVRLIGCTGTTAGTTADSQCVTTHNGLPVEIWGGTYTNAHTNIWASDGATSPMYAFFSRAIAGARAAGTTDTRLFGCYVEGSTANGIAPAGYALFNVFNAPLGASGTIFRALAGSVPAESNYCASSTSTGRGAFNDNASGTLNSVRYNIFYDMTDGVRCGSSSGAGGTSAFYGNTMINCDNGIFNQDANMLVTIKNNATKGSTNGVNVTATSMGNMTTNHNTLDPTIDADFVAGANDIVNADAGLGAEYFPTASGNCDGNGDATLEDWIGGRDPWGFIYKYKSDRVSRGAREIPAIYSGAPIQPDVF